LNKGDVIFAYLVGSGERDSSVQKGYRPCVIVSDSPSVNHSIFVVCPITKEDKGSYPFIQKISLKYESFIHYEQFFTIPADVKYKCVYSLDDSEMKEMLIKLSFCLSTARANLFNIEGIDSVFVVDNIITGIVKYRVGPNLQFSLSVEDYVQSFGEVGQDGEIFNDLNSIGGMKLVLEKNLLY
jgi:mRNA-degrading endonuclease toxin of MazEF toxin-antitoxin module